MSEDIRPKDRVVIGITPNQASPYKHHIPVADTVRSYVVVGGIPVAVMICTRGVIEFQIPIYYPAVEGVHDK